MEVTKISSESLQKAMETLGLIEKAEATATAEVVVKVEDVKSEELKKAEEAVTLAQAKLEELKNPKKEEEVEVKETIVKAEVSEELIKGFNDKIGAMAVMVQSKDEKIEELTKAVNSITEFNKALATKIGMIEKTPLDRKSVTTQAYVEKFEKAEGGKEKVTNIRTLSISNGKHRAEIADELFKAAVEKSTIGTNGDKMPDQELAKASQYVELRQVTPQLQQRLLKDFNIQVVR